MDPLVFILFSCILGIIVYAISRWSPAAPKHGKPSPPSNLAVIGTTETSIRLMWDEPDDDGGSPISGYIIQKCETSEKEYTPVTSVKECECLIDDLTAGTTYMIKVAARNKVGSSRFVTLNPPASTKPSTVKVSKDVTDGLPKAGGKPGPPSNLEVIGTTETSIRLIWQEPDDDGGSPISDYIIQKCEASKSVYTAVASVRECECLIEDLTAGTTYMIKVAARNRVGSSRFVHLSPCASTKSSTVKVSEDVTDGLPKCDVKKSPEELAKQFSALTEEKIQSNLAIGLTEAQLTNLNEKEKEKKDGFINKWLVTKYEPQSSEGNQAINLVLLGKTGAGKSSTGNLIVGNRSGLTGDVTFTESHATESCTIHIQKAECEINGVTVNIIDTPGFEDTKIKPEEIFTEISKVMSEFSDGIDGILFVLNMGNPRFTADQQAAFKAMEEPFEQPKFTTKEVPMSKSMGKSLIPAPEVINGVFGQGILGNCFVILTNIDSKRSIPSLSKYLKEEVNNPLGQLLINKLKNRVIGISNSEDTVYGRQVQRENIINLIMARKQERFSSDQFKQYQIKQLKLAGKLPKKIEHLSKDLQKVVSASLRPLAFQTIKSLIGENNKGRAKHVQDIVEKMMGMENVNKDWKGDVKLGVELTLDDMIDQLIGSAYWKKVGLNMLLFTVPAGVAIASIAAPEFAPFLTSGAAAIMNSLKKQSKSFE